MSYLRNIFSFYIYPNQKQNLKLHYFIKQCKRHHLITVKNNNLEIENTHPIHGNILNIYTIPNNYQQLKQFLINNPVIVKNNTKYLQIIKQARQSK